MTMDLKLSASWIVRHDEERPEIAQDYQQMKSGGWQLKKLTSTRYSEIVFSILTVVLSSSLYQLFANTQAGARFADTTRPALAFEQLRTPPSRNDEIRAFYWVFGLGTRPTFTPSLFGSSFGSVAHLSFGSVADL